MARDEMAGEEIEKIVLPKGWRDGIIGTIIVLRQYGDSVRGLFSWPLYTEYNDEVWKFGGWL